MPDSPRNDPPTRVTLPRKAYVFASLFAVVQLGIFFLQLGLQEDQRSTGDRALEVAVTQLRESLPAIRAGGRLSEEALEDLPETRRLTERSLELTRTATPLVRDLRDARIEETTRATGALARTLLASDVGETTRATRRLAESLTRADLPSVLAELTTQQRLRRLLVRSNAVLGEVRARHLVEKTARAAELAPEQYEVLVRSMRIQQQTLALQQEAVAIGREALAVAKEAEKHAESVDRKTGGTFPGSSGG